MNPIGACNVYKLVISLIIFLIVMEYIFGTIDINTHKWDNMLSHYNNNNTTENLLLNRSNWHNYDKDRKHGLQMGETTPGSFLNTLKRVAINNSQRASTIATYWSSKTYGNINASQALNQQSQELPLCPDYPPDLGNAVKVNITYLPSVLELESRFPWLQPGGHSKPSNCRAMGKIAIIIPFRCRAEHLLLFLQHMHPFLYKQQLDYTFYVVEQQEESAFNRAMLMNVGFVEALKVDNYDCFIFHDVDLLPEDERNIYSCPEMPRHMSVAINVFSYALPYRNIFGGVSAIKTEHFKLLNGFSNSFWGWGGEDDDMSNRIHYHKLHIARYPKSIAKYTMLTHKKEKPNPDRYETLRTGKLHYDSDGLSNLHYVLVGMKKTRLYTWLLVQVGKESSKSSSWAS